MTTLIILKIKMNLDINFLIRVAKAFTNDIEPRGKNIYSFYFTIGFPADLILNAN